MPYSSPRLVLQRALHAYQFSKREIAIAELNAVLGTGDPAARFVAEFYLARVHSEPAGPAVDHAKAFVLFRKIADENVTVDPGTSQRAPFVAKALIALAGYMRAGIADINLAPNPRRAFDYLHHAAVYFGDKDAQFELAKAYLSGDGQKDGSGDDIRRGLHHLAVLTEESYAPAQVVLGDLFWRGRHVKKDERRGLALAAMAVENAPAHERIWIEAGYAAIFCAAPDAVRAEAGDLVGRWHKALGRPEAPPSASGARASLPAVEFVPERQCASGEKVAIVAPAGPTGTVTVPPPRAAGLAPTATAAATGLVPLKSVPTPPTGFRAAGIVEASSKK